MDRRVGELAMMGQKAVEGGCAGEDFQEERRERTEGSRIQGSTGQVVASQLHVRYYTQTVDCGWCTPLSAAVRLGREWVRGRAMRGRRLPAPAARGIVEETLEGSCSDVQRRQKQWRKRRRQSS